MSKSKDNLETLLRKNGRYDGRPFSEEEIDRFLKYYHFVLKWNPRLHLTTLSAPEDFFERHLRESEFAETLLSPEVKMIWDLGSGLGVPGIPLAILRSELPVTLVESKRHKVIFLEEVAASLGLTNLAVVNSRIESLDALPPSICLTARAVEQMESLIPSMLKLAADCAQMIFFGSSRMALHIRERLPDRFDLEFLPLPKSENRFLINLTRST
ncbi:MAG TPA: 16S rRNA (guanine(527)-N(7))-methyltransferase RsmG [Blastocatellia bacterium]|nr:16S rRNA (guanine(527)-N(7))-methyltransferase RsmG [Blastocatellia bacterium]HMX24108.1 16S rRNA (guanine(527)-N(7))-methyltransferase RsmG [Blastocatellia bacterium]HMY70728.1 16S rRNA (guanine(527)-N(7))-methyltransferase RsmG [Blastocatellia bacterium]HMZ16695.1 16S rRNA (guanine(527)-N(7))-methyltransferase RsmG [Blastocatellia bacterium]HNG28086.1 16S rRNA (guanine(527)-N(7))-methyltransferase RsmG [Blastocatellia bacterium]